ncbi:MAG: STAS domain-containing protein [Devosia sp.]|nr:STAS domain-containing protein [Devosia sp.]
MNDSFSLELSGELGLRDIEKLKSDIMAALEAHDAVALETSLVESADASAVQLLLAAQKTANAEGKSLSLSAPASGALARTLSTLGLVAADGTPLVPETSTWTISKAAA